MSMFRRKRDKAPAIDPQAGYRRSPKHDISVSIGPVVSNKRGIIAGPRTSIAECWVPDDWCEHDKHPKLCRQCNEDGIW